MINLACLLGFHKFEHIKELQCMKKVEDENQ